MNVLDLFSGIGGFSLGLERAGMHTVAFCESDRFCRAILAKQWPRVPCYDDVRQLTGDRLRADGIFPDLICGGFPCQDISNAGTRAGLDGKSSRLWAEFARILGELRPRFAIVENVAALANRGLGDILGSLAAIGFDAEWTCIRAADLGAQHLRDRIWIVAYPSSERLAIGPRIFTWRQTADAPTPTHDFGVTESALCRAAHGIPHRVDRVRALGNALIPQIAETIGNAIAISERASMGDRPATGQRIPRAPDRVGPVDGASGET